MCASQWHLFPQVLWRLTWEKREVKTLVYLVRMDYGGVENKYSWLLTLREENFLFFPPPSTLKLCTASAKSTNP